MKSSRRRLEASAVRRRDRDDRREFVDRLLDVLHAVRGDFERILEFVPGDQGPVPVEDEPARTLARHGDGAVLLRALGVVLTVEELQPRKAREEHQVEEDGDAERPDEAHPEGGARSGLRPLKSNSMASGPRRACCEVWSA